MHRISVVIPVYNGASEVARAIDSALAQTGCDVEVIVVNDGSTDETAAVIDAYGDRVRAIHQQNAGLAAARNAGIAAASAEWIGFLDHDDLWQPEKLQLQLWAADRTAADVVYTNAANFGDTARVEDLRSEPDKMPEGDLFALLLMDNFIVVSSAIVRRTLLEKAGGFDETLGVVEDWDLWLRLSAQGARFGAVREPVTLYQWRAGSLSKNHERMRRARREVISRALRSAAAKSLPWLLRRKAMAGAESCSAWFLAASSPLRAAQWYAHALWYWPFHVNSWKGFVKGCLGRS